MQLHFTDLHIPFTVTEINRKVKFILESQDDLQDCWVTGEISNISRPASGHIYLTLKDANSQMKAVIWRREAIRLQRLLREGALVEAHGNVTVYENGGYYQLTIDDIRLSGEGQLFQEFIQLKNKLEAEGLFAQDRKLPLPYQPKVIGIITSPSGAALQDILHTIERRYPVARVLLSPAPVQGVDAPAGLLKALNRLERSKSRPDVIIIARGGGSIEDLWAFNDETLVREVADCSIPIVSGVGHETDFTLVDFAADVRAPTPTGAAELATPNTEELRAYLSGLQTHLDQLVYQKLLVKRDILHQQKHMLERSTPMARIQNGRQTLDYFIHRINHAYLSNYRMQRARLNNLESRLLSIDPYSVLKRGYALVADTETNQIITSVQDAKTGKKITIQVSDGSFGAVTD